MLDPKFISFKKKRQVGLTQGGGYMQPTPLKIVGLNCVGLLLVLMGDGA